MRTNTEEAWKGMDNKGKIDKDFSLQRPPFYNSHLILSYGARFIEVYG